MYTGFLQVPKVETNTQVVHAQSQPSIADLEALLASLKAQLATLLSQLGFTNVHFDRNLTVGSTGADVTALQNWLIFKKFLNLGSYPKGHFGSLTKASLIKWQRSEAISPASGYFGPVSRARLNSIFDSLNLSQTAPPNPQGLSIRCSPSTTQAVPGASVTWQAYVTGGTGNYTYAWRGTDSLSGSGSSIQRTYNTVGVKSANVSVNGQSAVNCSLSVNISEQQNHNVNASSFSVDLYKDQSLAKYADHAIAWRGVGGLTTYAPYRFAWRQEDPLPTSYWVNSALSFELGQILSRGYQRILLHNPFGQTPYTTFPDGCIESGQMIFSQYLQAVSSTPWLVNNFVETWKPVVESGIEVIAYIGSPDSYSPDAGNGDCEQMALIGQPSEWWVRSDQALQPLIDSGMSIAFDAAVGTSKDSYTYRLAESLRARGVRVYVESVPEARNPHWATYPFIMSNSQWSWLNPGNGSSVPLGQLSGEILRFVNYPTQAHAEINQILSDGYSASIDWNLPIRSAIPTTNNSMVVVDLKNNSNSPTDATYTIKTSPVGGALTPVPGTEGKYFYTANSTFVGTDSFTYTASRASDESLPATVTVNVRAEMPYVSSQQEMSAARQAGAGGSKVMGIWPLFDNDIQVLGINSMISGNMVPKRVISFQMGGTPVSYITGYDKNTFAPMAVSAGRVLVPGGLTVVNQSAAAIESKSENVFAALWIGIVQFFTKILHFLRIL